MTKLKTPKTILLAGLLITTVIYAALGQTEAAIWALTAALLCHISMQLDSIINKKPKE